MQWSRSVCGGAGAAWLRHLKGSLVGVGELGIAGLACTASQIEWTGFRPMQHQSHVRVRSGPPAEI